jgi:hypothetical protein
MTIFNGDNEKVSVGKSDSLEEAYEDFLKFFFGSENIFNEEKGFFICDAWIWPEEDSDLWNDEECVHVPSIRVGYQIINSMSRITFLIRKVE